MDIEDNATADHLRLFFAYPFDTDEAYQQGIQSILASCGREGHTEDVLRRSQVFYFNRVTGLSLTVEDVLRHEKQAPPRQAGTPASTIPSPPVDAWPPPDLTSTAPAQTQTLSFAQLKELIEQGRTDEIPNNRVIPNEISENKPSESSAPIRKKPWEVSDEPAQT